MMFYGSCSMVSVLWYGVEGRPQVPESISGPADLVDSFGTRPQRSDSGQLLDGAAST
jgi:hypothetical protein